MQKNYFYKSHHELILSPIEKESHLYQKTKSLYLHRLSHQIPTELIQSFGPTNIAFPFPLHLSLVLQEKCISKAKVEIGWLHQGIEKAFESVPWDIAPSFATRINPVVPAPIALGFILAMEKILEIDTKIDALTQNYRVLMLEYARIFHHLRVVNQIITLIAPYALMQSSRRVLEQGQALQTSVNNDENSNPRWKVGGIGSPINEAWLSNLKEKNAFLSKTIHSLKKDIGDETQIEKRLTGIGVITKEAALSFGLTGPTLRACGVTDDLRRSHPYFDYLFPASAVHKEKEGDAWARLKIRLSELETSLEITDKTIDAIIKILKKMLTAKPDLFKINIRDNVPCGTQTSYIESPEGELAITVVSNGRDTPYRVKLRTPSFFHSAALATFLQNADIDDVVLIILSLGITCLEVDR